MSWGVLFKGLGVQKDTQTPCWLRPCTGSYIIYTLLGSLWGCTWATWKKIFIPSPCYFFYKKQGWVISWEFFYGERIDATMYLLVKIKMSNWCKIVFIYFKFMCRCLDILLLLVFKAAIYKFNINSVQNKRVQEVKVSFVGEGGGGGGGLAP